MPSLCNIWKEVKIFPRSKDEEAPIGRCVIVKRGRVAVCDGHVRFGVRFASESLLALLERSSILRLELNVLERDCFEQTSTRD